MRKLFALVLFLVAAKLGYQEYLYRTATRDVIIGMVKERAVEQCRRQAKTSVIMPTGHLAAAAWQQPHSVALRIGNSGIGVQLWEINSAQWNARYRNPYLLIVPDSAGAGISCEYDILSGAAQVVRL